MRHVDVFFSPSCTSESSLNSLKPKFVVGSQAPGDHLRILKILQNKDRVLSNSFFCNIRINFVVVNQDYTVKLLTKIIVIYTEGGNGFTHIYHEKAYSKCNKIQAE